MRGLLLAILLTCSALGASDIRLPMAERSVTVEATTTVETLPVDVLKLEEWYIIESTEPLIVLTSPVGIVDIEKLSGPMTFRGRFAGGTKIETRVFSAPHLYAVTPEKPGKTELILIPTGVETAEQIVRQSLTVSGSGPQPPPDPDPDPDPTPTPTSKNVSLAIVEDTMNRSPETAILMNGLVAWTEFVDSGNDWRAYDLKTGEARGKKAITDLNGPAPGVVIYAKPSGQMIHRGDMPATLEDLKKLIGSLAGG